jgi:hypothetical protein
MLILYVLRNEMKAAFYITRIIALVFWATALVGVVGVIESLDHFTKDAATMLGGILGFVFYVVIGFGLMKLSERFETE